MEKVLKGKKIVIAIIVIFLLIDITTTVVTASIYASTGAMEEVAGKIIRGAIRFLLTCLLFFFLYKGHKWAKWLIVVLAILSGLFSALAFLATLSWVMLALAVVNIGVGIVLLASGSVRDFFKYQRGELN